MMKLNVTQNFAQQNPTELLTVTPLNLKRVPTIGLTNEKLPAGKRASEKRGDLYSMGLISDEKLMKSDRNCQ